MNVQPKTRDEWLKHHYLIECDYSQRILLSPKNSRERTQLFREGYNEITKITESYNPGGGETDYTDIVVSIIKKRLKKGSRVFDLGCATGNLLYKLALIGYEVEGIDVSDDLIEKANEKLHSISKWNSVKQADIMSYVVEKTFDCIVMDNAIEHFHPDTINDILRKCHGMLNENGYMIILTPHRFSGPHDISKYFLPLGSKSKGFHLKEFSFTDLYEHLKLAGFNEILGFPFHPRLFRNINLIPNCSIWAARKAIFLEKFMKKGGVSKVLTINATLSRILVAILFPAVCVAKK